MKISGRLRTGQIAYENACGTDLKQMRENLELSPEGKALLDRGVVALVWVCVDDIDIHNMNIELGGYTSDPDVGI